MNLHRYFMKSGYCTGCKMRVNNLKAHEHPNPSLLAHHQMVRRMEISLNRASEKYNQKGGSNE